MIKTLFNYFLRIGISVALLWWLFTKIDMAKTGQVIKSADLKYILVAFLFFSSTYVLTYHRWKLFIKALKLDVPYREIVRYFFIGMFGNLFLPSAIGGDAIKIYGLCKYTAHKAKVVASILLDRLSGYAGLVIVVVVAFSVGYKLVNSPGVIIPILLIVPGTIVITAVLFNEAIYEFCCRIFDRVPKIKKALMQMHYDIALVKDNKSAGYAAIGLSCVSHVCIAVLSFFIAKALHQDVKLIYFLIFFPLISVVSLLPSLGGLGVREAAAVYFFGKIGIDSGIAASITLISYIFMVIVGLIGGAIYVFTLSSGRIQHPSPKPEVNSP
ncbi:MAG: flippase-like domain-containing protein [Candidatus Omnitrophica bacterium]|nr:flippase-like domain-containing protein [Candidatus Omnitrophota bacterium]